MTLTSMTGIVMGIFYKVFIKARIVFYTVLVSFLCCIGAVNASESVFTVEDILVDVSAENAMTAKDKAFDQAQAQAFQTVLERLRSDEELESLSTPDSITISNFVQDFEITKEKLSDVRYIATFTFRFRPDDVQQYLNIKEGSVKRAYNTDRLDLSANDDSQISDTSFLILPYYQASYSDVPVLWSHNNRWMNAWRAGDHLHAHMSMVVPLGDLEDLQDTSDADPLKYDPQAMARLFARYNVQHAIITIAMPNARADALQIFVYNTTPSRAIYMNELSVDSRGDEAADALYNRAVERVYAYIQEALNTQSTQNQDSVYNSVSNDQLERMRALVFFNSVEEWARKHKRLKAVYGVEEVDVKSVSPQGAEIELVYRGGHLALKSALNSQDILIDQDAHNEFSDENALAHLVFE